MGMEWATRVLKANGWRSKVRDHPKQPVKLPVKLSVNGKWSHEDNKLYVGGIGMEYVLPNGAIASEGGKFVKIIDHNGF